MVTAVVHRGERGHTCLMQERYSRKTEAAELRRAFTILDAKGDDRIDADELGRLFRRLGHKEKRVRPACSPGR